MKTVFVLQHSYELTSTGEKDTKLIGVYSTKKYAEQARERLSNQPGFKELKEYFSIDEYPLDKDHWQEGFVTETYQRTWSVWR
ncbi:MAG: hypothetical protein F6K10_32885 [Moorea sp. SIO2B7]|nr:hypothetical protein [Moorena sp. SIO2B7]